MTTPLSDSMIVLRRVSFPPQKRQSWFEWSLTVAIFSTRNSSTAAPTEKRSRYGSFGFVYSGYRSYLEVAASNLSQTFKRPPTRAALLLDDAALVTHEGVVPVNLACKSRPTAREIFQSLGFGLSRR
jgi:hypothetical protein